MKHETSKNLKLKKSLEGIGLSEKEVAVYLALLELGSGTVSKISRYAGINRTTGYDILDSLANKGLANISGNKPIRSAIKAEEQWKNKKTAPVLIIDAGETTNTEPSTIVDITGPSPIILRSGIITKKEFDSFLKRVYI